MTVPLLENIISLISFPLNNEKKSSINDFHSFSKFKSTGKCNCTVVIKTIFSILFALYVGHLFPRKAYIHASVLSLSFSRSLTCAFVVK